MMRWNLLLLAIFPFIGCSDRESADSNALANTEWAEEGITGSLTFTPGGNLLSFRHDSSMEVSDFSFRYITPGGHENEWIVLSGEDHGEFTVHETMFVRPKGTGIDVKYTLDGKQKELERWTPDIKGELAF